MIMLELIIGLSNVPFMVLWFVMPESPRWLLAKGKKEEAMKAINRICEWNNKPTTRVKEFVESYTEEKVITGKYLDLFEHPSIRRNTILMCFAWFSVSMGYYGLFYNTPPLQWSIFLVFAFPAFFNMTLQLVTPYFENIFGRKFMLSVPLLIAGSLLVITTLLPAGISRTMDTA